MAQTLYNTFYSIALGLISVWEFLNSPIQKFTIDLGDNWGWDTLESIINFVGDLIVVIVNAIPVPDGVELTWLTFILGYGAIFYITYAIIIWFAQLFK